MLGVLSEKAVLASHSDFREMIKHKMEKYPGMYQMAEFYKKFSPLDSHCPKSYSILWMLNDMGFPFPRQPVGNLGVPLSAPSFVQLVKPSCPMERPYTIHSFYYLSPMYLGVLGVDGWVGSHTILKYVAENPVGKCPVTNDQTIPKCQWVP